MICGFGGSKSRLAKAAGAEPSGQTRDEKLHAVVARSTCRSQNVQNPPHHSRTTFGSWDVEKVHAVVARSTFRSQNVQSTPLSDHFWKLRCRKSARRLWREAHFEVKMYKTHHVRTTFGSCDVEKVHAVVARSTFRSQNVQNTRGSDHFGGSDVASLRFTTLRYITLHYTPLHFNTLHYTTLYYTTTTTTLHYTRLHSTTLNYTTLHYLHYTTLRSRHYTTLHYTTLRYLPLHFTTLHYTTLHSTPLHYNYNYNYTTTFRYTPLH